ncbi:hypothetical protein CSPARA_0678 [Campylobacter sputorum bv. paraureolyticus LMG 11764]|nr:hypothetical protein CSPARA_0678 [Campylobacter sputorum bv. paraureolyticus LMG 11764]
MIKIKFYIDLLKSVLVTLLVALFGMASYLFLNFDNLSFMKSLVVLVVIVTDCIILGFGTKVIIKKINELEDL